MAPDNERWRPEKGRERPKPCNILEYGLKKLKGLLKFKAKEDARVLHKVRFFYSLRG